MKKRYLLLLTLLIALSVAAIPLFFSWLQPAKPSELDQLRAEGWTIVDLDGIAEREGGFEIDYSKATDGNPPVSAGGVLLKDRPVSSTSPVRASPWRPPTFVGIKIIDNKLTLAVPGTESIQIGNRTTFQQAIDYVLRRIQPDPVLTWGQQRITFETGRPAGHTAKLLPIPGNRIPFSQPVRVVEWIPDDKSQPVEFGCIQLEPATPDPEPLTPKP